MVEKARPCQSLLADLSHKWQEVVLVAGVGRLLKVDSEQYCDTQLMQSMLKRDQLRHMRLAQCMVASRHGASHIVSDRKTILHADMRCTALWPYS